MQTFLPYPDFRSSAESLDSSRLGKQRVETLQILRALELPEYGWVNHPAVRMWRGYTPALVLYGLIFAQVWRERGHADTTAAQMAEFAPEVEADGLAQRDLADRGLLPPWLGDDEVHRSHRSRLLTKDPDHYRSKFAGTAPGSDYHWPPPSDTTPVRRAPQGSPLWVVRTESAEVTGTFVADGVVALGTDSGIDVDVTGRELPDLQALVGGRRRNSKPLLALARFVGDIQVGDDVGIFVEHDTALLVGRVCGPYEFRPIAPHGLSHGRQVTWGSVVRRAAVDPPASLQDVRPVFRVHRAMARTPDPHQRALHAQPADA